MDKQAEQLLSKIILKWGIQAQKWQAIEEVGEFLQALNKLNRVKLKDPLKEQGDPAFEKARKVAIESQANKASVVLGKVKQATDAAGFGTTGFLGGILSKVGGTGARNLKGYIDTITANLSFDTLQEMRAASKTGGALGSVSERELELLGASVASLDLSQDSSVLKQSLKDIETHYTNWLNANGYEFENGQVYEIE